MREQLREKIASLVHEETILPVNLQSSHEIADEILALIRAEIKGRPNPKQAISTFYDTGYEQCRKDVLKVLL